MKSSKSKGSILSFKTLLLYPGIVLSTGWTFLNIFKIIGYVNQLKNERPECTEANPNRSIIFVTTFVILFLLKDRIEHGSTLVF
jgi:hypothetical protein